MRGEHREDANYVDKFAQAFKALKAGGITAAEHPALYQAVIEKADYTDKLTRVFAALKAAGTTGAEHLALYQGSPHK